MCERHFGQSVSADDLICVDDGGDVSGNDHGDHGSCLVTHIRIQYSQLN